MRDHNYPVTLADTEYLMVTSKPVYFLVVASQDGFYDCVNFMLNSTLAMTSFYVAIFKPATATTMTRIMDLGNVKSQLVTGSKLQTIALTDPLDAVAGEKFYVGLLAVGGTMPRLMSSSLVAGNLGTDSYNSITQIPAWNDITALDSGTQSSFPNTTETITSSLARAIHRVWGALGTVTELVRPPAFYASNFNQINNTQVGLPWWGRSGIPQFAIYNETMSPQTGASGAFNYWVPGMRDNDHYIQVKLGQDMAAEAARNIDLYLGVRSARGGTGAATKLHLNSNSGMFRIVTVTTAYNNGGLTQRTVASTLPVFSAGDVVKFVADGSVYAGFYNDDPFVSWDDTGVISPVDVDHQRVNVMTSAVSLPNLQVVDNFEAGAYGGGVQLVAVDSIPSAEAFDPITIVNDYRLVPGKGSLVLTGKVPALVSSAVIQPPKGSLVLTGKVPRIFNTFTEVNTNQTDQPTPAGTDGVWVTLQGAGGSGGDGRSTGQNPSWGGAGGGGGARLQRFFVSAADLGPTYSVTRGLGVTNGAGGDSIFSSGSIIINAGGGAAGNGGRNTALSTTALGGTVTTSGIIVDASYKYSGGAGGSQDATGSGTASGRGGAGGGSGGDYGGTTANVAHNGWNGAASSYAAGRSGTSGTGGTGNPASDHTQGGGGGAAGGAAHATSGFAGGIGGSYGGGGGGGGAESTGSSPNAGNRGGDGYTLLEWV